MESCYLEKPAFCEKDLKYMNYIPVRKYTGHICLDLGYKSYSCIGITLDIFRIFS